MAMRSVYSSHVRQIGYENGSLVVEWETGKTSVYADVPEDIAEQVMNSPSIGTALRQSIKGVYEHRYI